MDFNRKTVVCTVAVLAIAASAAVHFKARASDHADTPAIAASPGTDLTDVYVFPSPANPNNVVLSMSIHPLIATGQGPSAVFDPAVLYQFKIDNTGDSKEDLVIQAKFSGSGATQKVSISGPVKPSRVGTQAVQEPANSVTGVINTPFTTSDGIKVFAGAREDSFFFDLDQFFKILPDRATPITGVAVANPNQPQAATWRAPGVAQDFLKDLNVLSIVVEMPKSKLRGAANGKIGVWATTSR